MRRLAGWIAALLLGAALVAPAAELDIASLRGAGLTDKQGAYRSGKYQESDFRYLAETGANFVRLPISYLFLTKNGDPASLDEHKLAEIDEAISWGRKYGLHVCLNLFSTPGYTIAEPNQTPSLWTDAGEQALFVSYWRALARRYAKVPGSELSFNLLNEPAWDAPASAYVQLMREAIEAIHAVTPGRWIFVDGLKCGAEPVRDLAGLSRVAQALHFYEPFSFTHYGAPWVENGGLRLPRPEAWPASGFTELLFGPEQTFHSPLVLTGKFPAHAVLHLKIGLVTRNPTEIAVKFGPEISSRLHVEAPQPWHDQDYVVPIPPNAQRASIIVLQGDRVSLRELKITDSSTGKSWSIAPGSADWELQSAAIIFDPATGLKTVHWLDRAWIENRALAAWRPLLEQGVPVMVQEFGCHNQTPTVAVIAYLRDCISVWREAGLGWALYSMRDSLGWVNDARAGAKTRPLPDGSQVDADLENLLKEEFRPSPPPRNPTRMQP